MGALRLAIIGGGPRALWAIEELAARAEELPALDIDVWEPELTCGAGRVYRTDQPAYWLMNLRAEGITTAMGSFVEWREAKWKAGLPLDPGHFPPRRVVGAYLGDAWAWQVSHAPPTVRIRHVRKHVTDIRRADDTRQEQWKISAAYPEADQAYELYDYVLVTVGHAQAWQGALQGSRVFKELWQVPDGGTIGVRGAALTFIDVMLAATLGRGGLYAAGTYTPSGREPILNPVNRSGRFMEVKAVPGTALDGIALPALPEYGQCIERCTTLAELEDVLADAAADFLQAAGVETDRAELYSVLTGEDATGDPVAELRVSIDVANGQRPQGAAWAIGEAWRRLYPHIVARASFAGRDDLPGFGTLARTLERVAFGPPAETAEILLAVIEAGVVRVEWMGKPWILDAWLTPDSAESQDVHGVIDAVIPPPGVVSGSLAEQLVQRGYARIRRGADGSARGLDVNPDASVPGQRGLAVVGRDAEDTVLGLDTLSRTLHSTIPAWADSLRHHVN